MPGAFFIGAADTVLRRRTGRRRLGLGLGLRLGFRLGFGFRGGLGFRGTVGLGRRLGFVGQISLLVAVFLEIGFVPARAGQTKTRRGQLPAHLLGAALRTNRRIGVGKFLQAVELVTATAAFEGVDGHGG
jgi:hypothetical protein